MEKISLHLQTQVEAVGSQDHIYLQLLPWACFTIEDTLRHTLPWQRVISKSMAGNLVHRDVFYTGRNVLPAV